MSLAFKSICSGKSVYTFFTSRVIIIWIACRRTSIVSLDLSSISLFGLHHLFMFFHIYIALDYTLLSLNFVSSHICVLYTDFVLALHFSHYNITLYLPSVALCGWTNSTESRDGRQMIFDSGKSFFHIQLHIWLLSYGIHTWRSEIDVEIDLWTEEVFTLYALWSLVGQGILVSAF